MKTPPRAPGSAASDETPPAATNDVAATVTEDATAHTETPPAEEEEALHPIQRESRRQNGVHTRFDAGMYRRKT